MVRGGAEPPSGAVELVTPEGVRVRVVTEPAPRSAAEPLRRSNSAGGGGKPMGQAVSPNTATSLLAQALHVGKSPVTTVRQHVLVRHAKLLGIKIKGTMDDGSNPVVQQALRRINDICSSPE